MPGLPTDKFAIILFALLGRTIGPPFFHCPAHNSCAVPYDVETIQRIAAKHGLPGEPSLMHNSGMVNEAWAIGSDFVLRITRHAECEDEAEREALVVPLVRAAGVKTPELLAISYERDIVPQPYTIYRRAPGISLGAWDVDPSGLDALYEDIGRELALLHAVSLPPEARRSLERDRDWGLEKRLAKALGAGKLSVAEGGEIRQFVAWTEPLLGAPKAKVLTHLDVHPWNLMVDPATCRLAAILDWGNACLYDPTIDFASMPLVAMAPMLRAYAEAGGDVDEGFVARALVRSVALACFELTGLDPELYRRQWWRMPPAGWPAMKQFIADHYPALAPPSW